MILDFGFWIESQVWAVKSKIQNPKSKINPQSAIKRGATYANNSTKRRVSDQ